MKKRWKWIAIYVAAIVVCAVIIYVVPSVMGLFEQTYVAEPGEVQVVDDIEGYVVRNDTVFVASKAGKINRLAEEGQLVRYGTGVVEITGDGDEHIDSKYTKILETLGDSVKETDGKAPMPGFVSYEIDGLESTMCGSNIDNLKETTLKELVGASSRQGEKRKCAKGDPVYRITANGDWWLITYVDLATGKHYEPGAEVTMEIGDEKLTGKVASKTEGKTKVKVVLSSKTTFENYQNVRTAKASVTTSKASGLVLKSESIFEINGVKGVLVKDKLGNNVWKPVRIKANNGTECAVYEDIYMDAEGQFVETISIYDEILAKPSEEDIAEARKAEEKKAKEAEEAEKKAEEELRKEQAAKEEAARKAAEEAKKKEEEAKQAAEEAKKLEQEAQAASEESAAGDT